MPYCPDCGTETTESQSYCGDCGASLNREEQRKNGASSNDGMSDGAHEAELEEAVPESESLNVSSESRKSNDVNENAEGIDPDEERSQNEEKGSQNISRRDFFGKVSVFIALGITVKKGYGLLISSLNDHSQKAGLTTFDRIKSFFSIGEGKVYDEKTIKKQPGEFLLTSEDIEGDWRKDVERENKVIFKRGSYFTEAIVSIANKYSTNKGSKKAYSDFYSRVKDSQTTYDIDIGDESVLYINGEDTWVVFRENNIRCTVVFRSLRNEYRTETKRYARRMLEKATK